MSKRNIIIIAVAFIIIILIIVVGAFSSKKPTGEILNVNESITTDKFEIKIDDYYEGDFVRLESVDYTFDKYLAVDVSIKNITDEEQRAKAFLSFKLDDGSYNLKPVIVDENAKKFHKDLYPDETFEVTVVFAVDDANEYILYYNKTLKDEDEKQLGWRIPGTDLEKKDVPTQGEHFNPFEDSEDEDEVIEESKKSDD